MSTSEIVAKILLEINAITLNPKKPFRYASGILSPVYTDCRVIMAYPKKRRLIRDLYIDAIKKSGVSFDVV
ncbi:MAG: orotate phosphoribosyltransferase, partial [Nanoarchaeota archaeon]